MNNQYEVLSSTIAGLFNQKEYFNRDIASPDNTGYRIVRKNDVVLSPQNLWMGNINFNDRFEIGIVSPSYKVFSINSSFDCGFVSYMLKTKRALWEYGLASEQGASIVRRNLNIENFMSICFRVPSTEEQDRIGKTLSLWSEKILIEQRILESLHKQKVFLLHQMFI